MADQTPNITITDASVAPKPKRGRPPGSGNKAVPTSVQADVTKAMATLDNGYNLIATALFMFGLTDSATVWVDSAEQLKATNKDALTASPKLAKYIANAGTAGGAGTLIITHGMAFAGLAKVVSSELAERRAARNSSESTSESVASESDTRRDPTLIPGM